MFPALAYLLLLFGLGFVCIVAMHDFRGRYSDEFGGCLLQVLLGFMVAGFFLFGWKYGLASIVLTFVFTKLTARWASKCAARLLGRRVGIENLWEGRSFRLMMAGKISFDEHCKRSERERTKLRERLSQIARRRAIAEVLEANNLSFDHFVEHYQSLRMIGLADIAWDIVADANQLSLFIKMRRDALAIEPLATDDRFDARMQIVETFRDPNRW